MRKTTTMKLHGINQIHNHRRKKKEVLSIRENRCVNKLRKNRNNKCNRLENNFYKHKSKKGKNTKKINKKSKKYKNKSDEKKKNS